MYEMSSSAPKVYVINTDAYVSAHVVPCIITPNVPSQELIADITLAEMCPPLVDVADDDIMQAMKRSPDVVDAQKLTRNANTARVFHS
jgi:hypothetical protein